MRLGGVVFPSLGWREATSTASPFFTAGRPPSDSSSASSSASAGSAAFSAFFFRWGGSTADQPSSFTTVPVVLKVSPSTSVMIVVLASMRSGK